MVSKILITVTILFISLTHISCASAQSSKKKKRDNLYRLIQSEQYPAATRRLKRLYASYPNSPAEEKKFLDEVDGAVSHLPKKHQRELEKFLDLNRDRTAGMFMDAMYYYRKGTKARGKKFANRIDKKKLSLSTSNFVNSIARFQSVLEDDPAGYLAHHYMGNIYSRIGNQDVSNAEFRSALQLSSANHRVWESFLSFNRPRWGGSYEMMEELITEMTTHEKSNPKLSSLKGLALADKADNNIRKKDFATAEEQIFKALDFGSNYTYGRTVEKLYQRVEAAGDETGACRIAKKVNAIYPESKRYQKVVDEC